MTFTPITIKNKSSSIQLESPFGYTTNYTTTEATTAKEDRKKREILAGQAKATAMGAGSQIFMQMFMMYMMGSSLHIFTIFMIYQMMSGPIGAMMSVQQRFSRFSSLGNELLLYKMIFIGIQLGLFGLGLYKLNTMGLLPLSPSDYVDMIPKSVVSSSKLNP